MKKKYIFLILIPIQLSIIGILFQQITHKKNILGTVSVNPIQQETIISSPSGTLQYFFEPKPDTTIKPEVIFPELEHVRYTINKDSLNQTENYEEQKDTGTFRIITIGDSHTFGQNVNTEDNYPSQLEQLLNSSLSCPTIQKFEVLNLGVYSYDIPYTIERFKTRGLKYDPDLVIWLFVADDFRRINDEILPKARQYTDEAKASGDYEKQIKAGNYYAYWGKARDEVVNDVGGIESLLLLQKEYMKSINRYYTGPLVLTVYTSFPDTYKTLITTFAQERKNTFFHDQLPNIYDNPDVLLPDLHPNKKGYTLIVNSLMNYLVDNKIVACSIKNL